MKENGALFPQVALSSDFRALFSAGELKYYFFFARSKGRRDAVCSTHDTFHFSHGKRFFICKFILNDTAMLM